MSKLKKEADLEKLPDPRKHQIVSFIKSGIRILGYIVLPFDILVSASLLVFSEAVGVYEELV
jgi:hypothetical protein